MPIAHRATICISDSGDERLSRTLRSLRRQTMSPHQILVERRGTVAGSRNLMYQQATGDIMVFLDTDQEAPPRWLATLLAKIPPQGYVCGPTLSHPEAQASPYRSYLARLEERHYAVCAHRQTAFPMGNSAWSRKLLTFLASQNGGQPFDERFTTGGEDYDLNLRATALGAYGVFIPEAWVWHDQSNLHNPLRIMRRKLRYCYGGALAQLKNGNVEPDGHLAAGPVLHWLELFQKLAQVWGLLLAAIMLRFAKSWRMRKTSRSKRISSQFCGDV